VLEELELTAWSEQAGADGRFRRKVAIAAHERT
jgi:hypothetical protein